MTESQLENLIHPKPESQLDRVARLMADPDFREKFMARLRFMQRDVHPAPPMINPIHTIKNGNGST